jgi:hypothetical protein
MCVCMYVCMYMYVCRLHPRTVLVDPIEAVQHVICRSNVCRVLHRIISQYTNTTTALPQYLSTTTTTTTTTTAKKLKLHVQSHDRVCDRVSDRVSDPVYDYPCPFSQPKFLIVEDITRIVSLFRASPLVFPVICKPLEACGTPTSHAMVSK